MATFEDENTSQSAMDLTSGTGLLKYLERTSFACSKITQLSGGVCNFTFRGQLLHPLVDGEKSIVIKHTEPYVAANRAYAFDAIRSYFEQAALTSLARFPPVQDQNLLVTTPALHHFYPETHTQIIQDYPDSTDLKTYLLTHNISDTQAKLLGTALGLWARKFHDLGQAPEFADIRATLKENSNAADLKFNVNAGRLLATADMFPAVFDGYRDLFQQIANGMKERQTKQNDAKRGIIHGDFWSGNILLPNRPFSPQDFTTTTLSSPSHPLKLLIIDWELSHLSSPTYDLGQCFAELYLLQHFKNIDAAATIIRAFVHAYGEIPAEDAWEVALHFGIHLVVWPCRVPGWGSRAQIERCLVTGREFVEGAWGKERAWFEGSVLESLFFAAEDGGAGLGVS